MHYDIDNTMQIFREIAPFLGHKTTLKEHWNG